MRNFGASRGLGPLRMAPWWRGPALLLRRGGVVIALVAAALVATLPAAAAVPFLSSSRSATLHHQISAACQWSSGVTVTSYLVSPGDSNGSPSAGPGPQGVTALVARRTGLATATARTVPQLGGAETTLVATIAGPTQPAAGPHPFPDADNYPVQLVSRDGFQDHIQVLHGPRGTGAWVSDAYAGTLHLKVGDQLHLYGGVTPGGAVSSVTMPVAAIYRDLRQEPDQPWWCDLLPIYRGPQGNRPTPVVIFTDQPSFLDALPNLFTNATHTISFPLANPDLDDDQAGDAVVGIARLRTALFGPPDSGFSPDPPNHSVVGSLLPQFTARAELVRRSMAPAVVPVAVAGVLVGLLIVGAAAAFWVQRRRRELTLLSAHGVGARALALKAVVESLPALVVGAVAGWSGAWALVRWAGPDPVLSGEAAPWAALGAAGTLLAALLTVAVVAGVACRSLTDQVRSRHHRVLRALPYELVLLAATVPVWRVLGDQRVTGDPSNGLGTAVHVPGRLLVVPIMVVAGLTTLAARLAVWYLRRRGRLRSPRTPAAFLGWRRVGRQAVMVAVLAGATSVPIALATYGATVTGSVHATIADEARLHLGSDVVFTLGRQVPIPDSLADRATEVLRLDGAIIGGTQTDLLGVDPGTFARAAYLDSRIDGKSLDELMPPIRAPRTGGPQKVVASALTPAGVREAAWRGDAVLGGTVDVVPTSVLPAQQAGYPTALVPKAALGDDAQYAVAQLWVRGDPVEIQRAARAANLPITQVAVAADRYANSQWEPLTYTFDYLTALSLLTGLVTLVGLLLYLESQAPSHRRAYVLLRRMGLRARSHRRAMFGELALPLVAGLIGGVAVSTALSEVLGGGFDVDPDVLPNAVVTMPYLPIGLIAAAVAVITVGAAEYAQRRIGRANPSEVLRDTI
ncbi:hypothetical protein GCM10023322_21800 [Rugosimonospora acidiphila]|uniref:ABC3 transporter permease C-terminal domain-containing protein n=1 Tax=Rugosimonospora acidiphila TaxID=556531 RepID=A0ABP9RR52_9ACTN